MRALLWVVTGLGLFTSLAAYAAPVGEAEVRQCIQALHEKVGGGRCSQHFAVESVTKVDARDGASEAFVIADVIFAIKQKVAGNGEGTALCTGRGWTVQVKNPYAPNSPAWLMFQSQADMAGGYFMPGNRVKIRKKFKFEKWESGWRCGESEMAPVELGWLLEATAPAARATNAAPSGGNWKYLCFRSGEPRLVTAIIAGPAGKATSDAVWGEFKTVHCADRPTTDCKCFSDTGQAKSTVTLENLRANLLKQGSQSVDWKATAAY